MQVRGREKMERWSVGERNTVIPRKLMELWDSKVATYSSAPAIIGPGGEVSTYGQIQAKADLLQKKLNSLEGHFVATLLPPSVDYIVCQIAVMRKEAILAPLDSSHPPSRIVSILGELGHPVLLTNKETRDQKVSAYPHTLILDFTEESDGGDATETGTNEIGGKPEVEGVAMCLFTSGTTGTPKGVYMKHSSIVNFVTWFIQEHAVSERDTSVFYSFPSFDMAITQTWPFLISGGTVFVPPTSLRRNLPELECWVAANRISFLKLPSIVAIHFLDKFNLKHLRFLAFGGELIPALEGKELPAHSPFSVGHSYGTTEGSMGQTNIIHRPGTTLTLSVGRPITNLELWVLDAHLNVVEPGIIGDVYLGGAGICVRGYHNRASENERSYIPWGDEANFLFKTGDLGMWNESGILRIVGRSDDQIKIAGNRIELAEIELAMNKHPLVSAAVVVFKKGPPAELKVFATSLPTAQGQLGKLNIGAVVEFLRTKLPEYGVPSSLVVVDSFPLTVNGKVDKEQLWALSQAQVGESAPKPPISPEQIQMARLWGSVLKFPADSIYLDHTFYQLGGNSLSAAQLLHALKQTPWNREVTFTQFFERPTLLELTQLVGRQSPDPFERRTKAELLQSVESELKKLVNVRVADRSVTGGILLTGSTGYLGSFLLAELLEQTATPVYCLVRAGTNEKGMQRITDNLAANHITLSPGKVARILPLAADLTQPNFGLCSTTYDEISSSLSKIVHCAADVHHFRPYADVEGVNVKGVTEILRFACRDSLKEIHYISTAAVNESYASDWKETELGLEGPICGSGYSQTKWVGEKVLTEAANRHKMPICIYRVGDIGSDRSYMAYNHNDLFCNIIKSFLTMNSYVGSLEWPLYTKADLGSKALVKLFLRDLPSSRTASICHVGYRAKGAMDKELERLGLRRLPLSEWIQEIRDHLQESKISRKHMFVSSEWFSNRFVEFESNSEEFISYLNFSWHSEGTEELLGGDIVESLVIRDVDIRDYVQKIKNYEEE